MWEIFASNCEKTEDEGRYADIVVDVTCDDATKQWKVNVTTYQYDDMGLQGETLLDCGVLTLNDDDEFVGVVDVDLYDDFDNHQCTFTLTFGP